MQFQNLEFIAKEKNFRKAGVKIFFYFAIKSCFTVVCFINSYQNKILKALSKTDNRFLLTYFDSVQIQVELREAIHI